VIKLSVRRSRCNLLYECESRFRFSLRSRAEPLPLNVFFPKIAAPKNEFSLVLLGWDNTSTNTARDFLTTILHTYDTEKRLG
jgi:hypothetical protein